MGNLLIINLILSKEFNKCQKYKINRVLFVGTRSCCKNYEEACVALLEILGKIDNNFGGIEGIEIDYPHQLNDEISAR